jgi:hypothetical protein
MKQLIYCIFLAAFFTACSGSSPLEGGKRGVTPETQAEEEHLTADIESNGAIEEEQPEATLTWKDLGPGEYDVPRTQIILTIGDKKTILDTISNDCSDIARSEYDSYGIPKDAVTAFGGWYAGGGDYFYLAVKNGKPAVYHGWVDEAQEDEGYHWKKWKM